MKAMAPALCSICTLLGLGMGLASAWAQGSSSSGIYTCIDSKGRRLTSDRPILECIDREQKELSSSGTVRRSIGPSMTAAERAVAEEQERKAEEERQRLAEEKRRERALLQRYPNLSAHERERRNALAAVGEVMRAAQLRIRDLQEQRQKLLTETEFYAKDPSKMPPKLRRELDENQKNIEAQQRFLANQEDETKRVNARFDEDLKRLKVLWAQLQALPTAAPAATSAASAPVKR